MPTITYITQIERESADCTTATIKDYTPWGTVGYPNRVDIGLFMRLVKRSADSPPVDTSIVINNTDPLNVIEWNISLAGDGWYFATIFGYTKWVAGTYDKDECVIYATNGNVYKAKANGVTSIPTTTADWQLITDPTSVDQENLANSGIYINNTHNFTTCNGEIKVGNQLETLADQIIDGRPKDWEDTTMALLGRALLNGAWVKHYRVKNQQAQVITDFINQRYPNNI